jgi:hypothetical protein
LVKRSFGRGWWLEARSRRIEYRQNNRIGRLLVKYKQQLDDIKIAASWAVAVSNTSSGKLIGDERKLENLKKLSGQR